MRILDTFPSFPQKPNVQRLREYYASYPDVFEVYFSYHCKNTDERLTKALERYRDDWDSIQKVHRQIAGLVEDVVGTYKAKYHLTFPIDVNLIVGAYGSNAYTHREIIPDITFAMERLTAESGPLKVIIAHEFGHATHNIISDQHRLNWKKMRWENPYIWLLREGAATHFSREIVPELKPSVYFSYHLEGDEWFEFAEKHKRSVIREFAMDIRNMKESGAFFKEWFSINGGSKFGYTRLAYYIADCMFQDFVKQRGEIETLLLWKNEAYFEMVEDWLSQQM
ncbi:hypothetical protein ACFSTA_02675 [Ornithinibacillus salinisoli]|uniref:Aminopeptidase n=1 Tax=Ornithinibacillus salinisoli TaxID=1848459 RepID=A0ABW4VUC8_9BACI